MKIKDLPIRGKIKFGAYSVNGEIPHKIRWLKAHGDSLFISEFLEDQCAFDAKEPGNEDNEYRRRYGNNRFSVSNVQQFINSDQVAWYHPAHEADAPPTGDNLYQAEGAYLDRPGFLSLFEPWEMDAIEEAEVKTALPKVDIVDDGEKYEMTYCKVFLPSKTNLTGKKENGVTEGEFWDLFKNGEPIHCALSPECYEHRGIDKPDNENEKWYYNLRSPVSGESFCACCVAPGGGVVYAGACHGILGVRPALILNPEILISDEPDEDGYYEVLECTQEVIEIDESELFEILMR